MPETTRSRIMRFPDGLNRRLTDSFLDFFLKPASAKPLAALRIGVAITLLLQVIMCAPDYFEWYGTEGFLQGSLMDRLAWGLPQPTDLIRFAAEYGVSEKAALTAVGVAYCIGLVGLLAGWKPQAFALLAWAAHLIIGEGHATAYGIDLFANIALFYLIFMPSRISDPPSWAARLSLRVWQIHLSIVYLISGVEKAVGPQWRNGEAIWRSLNLPVYKQFDLTWMAWTPWLALILSWGTLVVEIGYPFLIFPRKTRSVWIALTVGMHIGIGIFLGLHLFALLMAIFTLAAFAIPAEPGHADSV